MSHFRVISSTQVPRLRHHVVQRILTLSCPRCGQAFVDRTGCAALTCSRAACQCHFCAFCLKDCGSSAHAHAHVKVSQQSHSQILACPYLLHARAHCFTFNYTIVTDTFLELFALMRHRNVRTDRTPCPAISLTLAPSLRRRSGYADSKWSRSSLVSRRRRCGQCLSRLWDVIWKTWTSSWNSKNTHRLYHTDLKPTEWIAPWSTWSFHIARRLLAYKFWKRWELTTTM